MIFYSDDSLAFFISFLVSSLFILLFYLRIFPSFRERNSKDNKQLRNDATNSPPPHRYQLALYIIRNSLFTISFLSSMCPYKKFRFSARIKPINIIKLFMLSDTLSLRFFILHLLNIYCISF